MTTSILQTPPLQVALCAVCAGYSWPHTAWGCRVCGADAAQLSAVVPPQVPRLLNLVTVHAPLAPGLETPLLVGEVELAPGLVEEALVAGVDESSFRPGQPVAARRVASPTGERWCFMPEGAAA